MASGPNSHYYLIKSSLQLGFHHLKNQGVQSLMMNIPSNISEALAPHQDVAHSTQLILGVIFQGLVSA